MLQTAFSFVTEDERDRIEDAIAEGESLTSVEIVCAVATESGRYDRAESLIGLAGAVTLLGVANATSWWLSSSTGQWNAYSTAPVTIQLLAVITGFFLGSASASYIHWLRRIVVRSAEIGAEALRAASHVFVEQKLGLSGSCGGLLIYVSLFERQVVILADPATFEVLKKDGINKLKGIATAKLRANERVEAFVQPIATAVEILQHELPRDKSHTNELSDTLVCIHPRP